MIFKDKCIDGLKMNIDRCLENLEKFLVFVIVLVLYLGYDKVSLIF